MKGYRGMQEYGQCVKNPQKCCYDSHDLECPSKFSPPLLSTTTEFCTEALAKGIPIPKCILAKPKKLLIEKEAPPSVKPATSKNLRNWQKWCYIWRQTYNNLTAKRENEGRPPVMSSGEIQRMKKEDKELFDRTMHAYHLTGFEQRGQNPIGIAEDREIKHIPTKSSNLDFPEMKRHRYSNYIRNEISVPPRKIKGSNKTKSNQPGFNCEETWTKTKHVMKIKDELACDFQLYGKTDPGPDNLILRPVYNQGLNEKFAEPKGRSSKNSAPIPQVILSPDSVDEHETKELNIGSSQSQKKLSVSYEENRGPILQVRSQFSQLTMTFSPPEMDFPLFIANPANTFTAGEGDGLHDNAFFYDEDLHFSITTKSKETQVIRLKNMGTTMIRYQWFRSPPTYDAQQMLENPSHFKNIRLETDDNSEELDEDQSKGGKGKDSSTSVQPESTLLKRVAKKTHPEFHLSSLPGVILPGQSCEFPIIFRSKRPGYFHETVYLLTHPRLACNIDGRPYAVRLSGVCCDVELNERNNEQHEQESLRRYLADRRMEEEALDLMDSILDRALFEVTNPEAKIGSSLPNGRVTAESIYVSHNPNFYYYFGKSELAVDLMNRIVELLVPKERLEKYASCDASLQCFYNLILNAKEESDLNWQDLRSEECEKLLQKLNIECMQTLKEQRMFAWPTTARRKYTACYSSLVGTIDEVLVGFDRLHNLHNAPAIKLVDEQKSKAVLEDVLRRLREEQERKWRELYSEEEGESADDGRPLADKGLLEILHDEEEDHMEEDENTNESETARIATFNKVLTQLYEGDGSSGGEQSTGLPTIVLTNADKSVDLKYQGLTSDGGVEESEESGSNAGSPTNGSGDAQPPTILQTRTSATPRFTFNIRASAQVALYEEIQTKVTRDRLQVLKESRIKLFEDTMCAGIEKMLVTVDTFNNMLDYKDSDAVVVINGKC